MLARTMNNMRVIRNVNALTFLLEQNNSYYKLATL